MNDSKRLWLAIALGAYAVFCVAVLSAAAQRMEPDDAAYRGSIVAMTQGHFLTLSSTEVHALAARVDFFAVGNAIEGPAGPTSGGLLIPQWVRLPDGRWISEKNPGYPFLAVPFQVIGLIRLAPLAYGALGCLGLFAGARRWLGPRGGAAAVGLFCASGAAMFFAWDDYMAAFTDASLIAAGTGALIWTLLAEERTARRRVGVGLLGFLAIETAVFVRYTNIVVLGCAVIAVLAARRLRPASVPRGALAWWLGSVALSGIGVAAYNAAAYGGPLKLGYRPGEISFRFGAISSNLRYLPVHLIYALPTFVLGLAGLAGLGLAGLGLAGRRARPSPEDSQARDLARRDFAVGLALAGSWFSVWGLYSAYTWTAQPGIRAFADSRFYLPAIGAISLLGAWLLVRWTRPAAMAAVLPVTVVVAMFGLGGWSFTGMMHGG